MRRRTLIIAVVLVGLGVIATLTGRPSAVAVPLLVGGIAYAVAVLVMDRRRPRP